MGAIASSLVICRQYADDEILSEYFMQYLDAPLFFSQIRLYDNGTAQPNLAAKSLEQFLIPLPPLEEQHRIVAKIEEILPYIDQYDKAYTKLEIFNKKFPEDMKKSILQMAMQGKLVEQRPEEGTADELYEQIVAEKTQLIKDGKIKKEKPLPEIAEDEIPFDIPSSWKWVRLGNICTKLVDGDHNPPKGVDKKTDYIMASSTNINNNTIVDIEKVRYLTQDIFEKENERTQATDGDIFFTSVGTLGRSCVYKGGYNICFQRSVSVIRTLILNYYLKYTFDSAYFQYKINREATGTAQKGFYLKQLAMSLIPIPPLEEQQRIVAKIEELLPYCDQLIK